MPATVKEGDTVAVHFTGKLADGSIVDTSKNREPVHFKVGDRRVIPGLDKAVAGMSPGEKKTATVPAEDAYGTYRPDLVVQFTRDRIPPEIPADVGQEVRLKTKEGHTLPAVIVECTDDAVKFDANHPLAGRDLTYEIELVDVVKQA
jgi:peptidylprolyl isomerase